MAKWDAHERPTAPSKKKNKTSKVEEQRNVSRYDHEHKHLYSRLHSFCSRSEEEEKK